MPADRIAPGDSCFINGHQPSAILSRITPMTLTLALLLATAPGFADNTLTAEEKAAGWVLLFDGKTLDGWKTSSGTPSKTPVDQGSINPHKCGGYMMIHDRIWSDFVLSLDFKISPGCNSG